MEKASYSSVCGARVEWVRRGSRLTSIAKVSLCDVVTVAVECEGDLITYGGGNGVGCKRKAV